MSSKYPTYIKFSNDFFNQKFQKAKCGFIKTCVNQNYKPAYRYLHRLFSFQPDKQIFSKKRSQAGLTKILKRSLSVKN